MKKMLYLTGKAQWLLYVPPTLTYVLAIERVHVFLMVITTNNDYFPKEH
jgi:hypothetical protein